VTPGMPPYVRDADDRRLLRARHDAYVAVTEAAYRSVRADVGLALMAHTYAPRTVDVEVDDQIVESLRRAYAPAVEPTWPLRPEVDLIARDPGGRIIAEPLVRTVAAAFADDGFDVAVSGTYPMHPSTLAFHHLTRLEPRAVCVEVRRDLLVERFTPLAELHVAPAKVARVVAPLARAIRTAWGSSG
jgi:hypothetical protein